MTMGSQSNHSSVVHFIFFVILQCSQKHGSMKSQLDLGFDCLLKPLPMSLLKLKCSDFNHDFSMVSSERELKKNCSYRST